MSADATITCSDVVRTFGEQQALAGLDLEVGAGQIVGLLGPSGSGKTTTIKLLTGLLRPTSGRIEVLGVAPVAFTRDDRRRIGYLAQRAPLLPQLSVVANLRYVAGLYGVPRRRKRIAELLELLELRGHERKAVGQTSGGMQRRAALAAALLHDPEVVFLDEPTAALDPLLRSTIWDHLRRLRAAGRTIVVTTHYVGEAIWCDRVAILAEGRLVADGTPAELRRRAAGGDVLELRTGAPPGAQDLFRLRRADGVRRVAASPEDARTLTVLVDDADVRVPEVVAALSPVEVATVELRPPGFDDVFATLVAQHRDGGRSA